jgi:hypothetical protein
MINAVKKALPLMLMGLSFSHTALAVSYGEDVTEDEYQDFIVRIKVTEVSGSSLCGGALVGEKFLITAAHCVGDLDGYFPFTYSWHVDQGAANTISIVNAAYADFYGDDAYSRTYTIVKHVGDESGDEDVEHAHYQAYVDYVRATTSFELATIAELSFASNATSFASYNRHDIVVLELNEAVPYSTGALIDVFYDETNDNLNIPYGSTFDFQGWGQTETGSTTTQMQKTTQRNTSHSYDNKSVTVYDSTSAECVDDMFSYCYIPYSDSYRLMANEDTGSLALPGDSGTPNMYDGKFVGVVSTVNQYGGYNNYAMFDYYIDQIQAAINQITFPNSVGKEVDSGDSSSYSFDVPIQNFTDSDVSLYPSVTLSDDSVGYSVSGDCDGVTLETNEGCTLTLTINSSGGASFTEDFIATIALNDNAGTEIPVTISIASVGSSSGSGVYEESTGGSSGGSTGWLSLVVLGGLVLRRQTKNSVKL